mgnify:FL=1
MREKLETLSISELKMMAKEAGIKGISLLRKSELIDVLCEYAKEMEEKEKEEESKAEESKRGIDMQELDSGVKAEGILEVMPDGFGFIRCANYLPGDDDVYVAPSQIKRFRLKTGDIICGSKRIKAATEKFAALLYLKTVNGCPLSAIDRRPNFEDLTPIFPNERIHLETSGVKNTVAMRVVDLLSPIGKGQRGMIVSPPKAGKTTLLKCINGVLKWNSGEVFIDNKKVNSIKDLKDIAYVPQAHSFSFSYTVKELSIMGRAKYLNIFSTPSKSDYDIVEKVLDEMGISHLKDRKCSELSGGQLQLVFLARALVGEPKILILDEPESHLDFKNQTKILRTIVQLAKKKNITCIFNTHYPEYALRISDKSMLIGKDDYIIGKTSEIINEKNLKKYFEIDTKIVEIEDEKQKIKSVVITDNLED